MAINSIIYFQICSKSTMNRGFYLGSYKNWDRYVPVVDLTVETKWISA